MPRSGSLLVSCLLLVVILILVLGRWSYATTGPSDTATVTTTSDTGTATTTETAAASSVSNMTVTTTVTTTRLVTVCVLSLGVCPFVTVSGVAPDPPQVYDMVAVTVHVQSNEAVRVMRLDWAFLKASMIVEWEGSAALNMSGIFDYTVYHAFTVPGNYYLRFGLVDAQNRTAQDTRNLYVDRQATTLTLSVTPPHINSTKNERFTLEAYLTSNTQHPIPNEELMFYYGSDDPAVTEMEWLPIAAGGTDSNGYVRLIFNPPFDGYYRFKVTYPGDELHTPSEAEYGHAIVTPEFQLPALMIGLSLVLGAAVSRRFPQRFYR